MTARSATGTGKPRRGGGDLTPDGAERCEGWYATPVGAVDVRDTPGGLRGDVAGREIPAARGNGREFLLGERMRPGPGPSGRDLPPVIGDDVENRISSKETVSGMGAAMGTTASTGLWKSTRGYWIVVPLAAAWILSVMSWLGICSDGCEESHLYRFFGFPISPLGVGFFTVCGFAFLTRNRFRLSGFLIPVLLSGALGSEFVLVWIQKYVIGRWCPLCVGIALSVVTACVLTALERLPGVAVRIRGGERNLEMKRLAGKTALILFAFLAGIGGTAIGLKKPDAIAAGLPVNSLAFGETESRTEVYIITDWFCPACRAAEPEILKGARKAMRQAKVVFVDYPVHPETFNFIPYNLSFIVREKAKYIEIREAMATLARKTKEPTPEDVQAAVSPLGVKYVPLNYVDVMAGMQYFNTLIKKFKVPGTPSVVVLESRTGKTKTLYGILEITSDNILKSVAEVSGK